MKTISRYIMTLALLITAVTGAWADNVLYATVDGNTMTLMFGEKPDGAYVHDASNSNWATSFKHGISTAVIDASCRNFDGNSTRYLFYKFNNISSIEGLSNLNTENVTQMDNMFEGCKPLTSIDLSNFNTAKVTSMAGMFNSCEALPSIDLSSFNTAKVTSMSYMFKNCSSLTTITVGEGWNTDKVTSSREMFTSCSKLPNFNSGKTDKTNAFAGEGGYLTAASGSAGPEVTISDDQTSAEFEMPSYDATLEYELVRDMSIQMTATMGDGTDGVRYRVKKAQQGEGYEPADLSMTQVLALVAVNDGIEHKDLTLDQDYTVLIYPVDENGQILSGAEDGVPFQNFTFAPGLYALKAFAKDDSDYAGETALSNTFKLFQGYEVEVAAKEFITYYKDEPLYVEDEAAELYTIQSVNGDQAVLSDKSDAMPSNTPMLVYNKSNETKVILLIPCAEPDMALTVAPEFQGTLTATTIAASTDAQTNYAFNGKQFVWVKDAITVGANKAWLEVPVSTSNARTVTLVFDNTTRIDGAKISDALDGDYYDLNGRKLNAAPTRKGIYIQNGRKVVVK